MFKRMIGLCTAALMLVSLLPAAVWAEGTDSEQTAAPVLQDGAVETAEVPAELETNVAPEGGIALYSSATSGSCGENVTWSYDADTGTLTISGEGEMKDFSATYDRDDETYYKPTYPWPSSIARLIVKDGVTRLGSFAFYKCTSLVDVSLPESVEAFGSYCFAECPRLISLTIPPKVTVIPQSFCEGCWNIEEITIPNGVTHIKRKAFYGTQITTLTIPDSVVQIGSEISASNKISHITYNGPRSQWEKLDIDTSNTFRTSSGNKYEASIANGTIYGTTGKIALTWEVESNFALRISGMGEIPDYELGKAPWYDYASFIGEIILDSLITRIGNHAFYNCTKLKEVRSNSKNLITGCNYNIEEIGESAFELCTTLSTFPFSEMKQLESVGRYSFHNTGLSGNITLPDSLEHIEHGTFENTPIGSVIISNNVTAIGQFSFYNCSELTDIFYRGTQAQWKSLMYGENNKVPSGTILHLNSWCRPGYSTKAVDSIPASCTTPGSEGGSVCSGCGALVSGGTVVPATGHTEVTDVAVAATCGSAGKTEGKHCSVCNEILVAQSEIPATGKHTWDGGVVTTAATSSAEGVMTFTCTVCKETKTEAIPMLGTLPGDVNGDGKVDITDMALVYEYLTGQKVFDDGQKKAADVVNDGGEGPIVDVYDLQRLYEAVSGIRPF